MLENAGWTDAGLIGALFHLVVAPATAVHALLYKRDPRAALGWVGLCLLLPLAGPLIYLIFGVNRIRRRARRLGLPAGFVDFERGKPPRLDTGQDTVSDESTRRLARIGARLSPHALVGGNRVSMFANGDEAYPAMLEAIEAARQSIRLATYIFDTDQTGRRFIEALAAAHRRGVDVRVIVDGVGQWYHLPPAPRLLRRLGVPVAVFLPPSLLPPRLSVNLRLHHKILTVDGHTGFTGGMNIGDRHVLGAGDATRKAADLHFSLHGPVVGQLEREFLRTWAFVHRRDEPLPEPETGVDGGLPARVLTDGPDEDLDAIVLLLQSMIAEARESVAIMTPYFLPPRELIGALQAAALRGLDVKVVLPRRNNLPFVHWATRNMLWELLYYGVRVYYQPPPFSHAKLAAIDRHWAMIGSANWDARSLRLNFELQVELFDRGFAGRITDLIERAAGAGDPVSLEEVDGRSLPERLRDSICWLFSPYL
ncbi:MAG: cardiolipin synthase [Wenzhouxiangellaceae bacterium]